MALKEKMGKLKMKEASFFSLQSQTNVYSMTTVVKSTGQHKILVSSVRGKVILAEYNNAIPISKEVHFTYIPGDADIVSIDAFNKHHYGKGIIVGITFVKSTELGSDDAQGQFLNIYSEWITGSEFNLERVAQGCQNIELAFNPFKLYHTELVQNNSTETVFLLSGSDLKVHIYKEEKYSHTFSEVCGDEYFPEFSNLESSVWCMECQHIEEKRKRITAYGCMDGSLSLAVVDTNSNKIIEHWKRKMDGPVTSVKLFNLHSHETCPSFVGEDYEDNECNPDMQSHHLLVTNALEASIVCRNILDQGLSNTLALPESDAYDSVYCSCVSDVDFDGQKEIILGTYGQELLVYKFMSWSASDKWQKEESNKKTASSGSSDSDHKSASAPPTPQKRYTNSVKGDITQDDIQEPDITSQMIEQHRGSVASTLSNGSVIGTLMDGEYQLMWHHELSNPVIGLEEVDVTMDGLKEIAVLSLKGLHILQHDLNDAAQLVLQRLQDARMGESKDVFMQLQQEAL